MNTMIDKDKKLSIVEVLKADLQQARYSFVLIKLLILPLISILMSYVFLMKFDAIEFYSQSNTFKQCFIVFGIFLVMFLPFLITIIMHSKFTKYRIVKSPKVDLTIPIYVRTFSRITQTIIYTILSLLILLVLIASQVIILNMVQGLELSLDFEVLKKLSYYLLFLPILILPFISLIALIQNYSQNIIFTFILPLITSLTGNALVISNNEFIIFSPINSPITIFQPMFSTSTFDLFNFIIVIGVCIASVIIFSYLIVLRGARKNG